MPIKLTIDPKGLLSIESASKKVKQSFSKILMEIGFAVRSTSVRNIQKGTPRTGKVRKGRIGRGTRSSARGEYPKSNTGRLAKSLIAIRTGPLQVSVGSTFIRYGPFLEFGTRNMEARPFLAPSLKANERNMLKITRRHIKDAF